MRHEANAPRSRAAQEHAGRGSHVEQHSYLGDGALRGSECTLQAHASGWRAASGDPRSRRCARSCAGAQSLRDCAARRQHRCQRCRARARERARGRTGTRLNALRERMRCKRAAHHALRGNTDAAPEAAQAAGKLRRRKGRRATRCAQDQHRRHSCLPVHFAPLSITTADYCTQ